MLDRRNFIKAIIRNGFLLGLIATGSFLIFKENNGEVCNLDFICQNCKKSKSCSLPEAESYRANKSKNQRYER